ncbi:NAD(P)H-binding protein [Chitinimonas sp.]|uniref:NAD(P)H-binding protein n=1 Tax=Chitinimonas sp. TaxID=1934313 RepID=UPI0035AF3D5B
MTTLLILGGTGLVGQQLLAQALADPRVDRVLAPTRRPLAAHAKLSNPSIDYAQLPDQADWWRADAVLCALGTTIRIAGSQAAFRQVDHDFVLAAAALARRHGTPSFVLNSSLGADARSRSFYLRVKGEIEDDLAKLGFASLTVVRPSLLDGGPRPDSRPGERAAIAIGKCLGPLLAKRWRPVATARVAAAMLAAARASAPGCHYIESDQLHP